MEFRRCNRCKHTLSLDEFKGDRVICLSCSAILRENSKRTRNRDIEATRAADRERAARKKAKDPETYLAAARQRYADKKAQNPEAFLAKQREQKAASRRANPEKRKAADKKYREKKKAEDLAGYSLKNRDRQQRRRLDDPVGYTEALRKTREKRKAKYPEKVREQQRLGSARRRARKKGLQDTLTAEQWQNALDWWDGCAYCGANVGKQNLVLDHAIPLSSPDCPGTTADNCLPACSSCNFSKNANPLREFLERNFGHTHSVKRLAIIAVYFATLR